MTDVDETVDTRYCWNEGNFFLNSTFVIGYTASGHFKIGVLINDVVIPAGATINDAHLTFRLSTNGGSGNAPLYANDTITPVVPTSVADANGKTRTTAYVSITPSGASGSYWDTPDIKTIIQELVDSYDYSAGEPMMFFVPSTSGSGGNYWYFYMALSEPTLHITYTSLGGRKVQVMFV